MLLLPLAVADTMKYIPWGFKCSCDPWMDGDIQFEFSWVHQLIHSMKFKHSIMFKHDSLQPDKKALCTYSKTLQLLAQYLNMPSHNYVSFWFCLLHFLPLRLPCLAYPLPHCQHSQLNCGSGYFWLPFSVVVFLWRTDFMYHINTQIY